MKIRVYHGLYGCGTGCCGHWIELRDDEDTETLKQRFEFDHPESEEDALALAQHVVKHRWPECYDTIDWSTIEIDYLEGDHD